MSTFTAFGMFWKGPVTTDENGNVVPLQRIQFQILKEFDNQIEAGKQIAHRGHIDPQEKEELTTSEAELQYQFQDTHYGLVIINNNQNADLRVRGYYAGNGLVETGQDEPIHEVFLAPGGVVVFSPESNPGVSRVVVRN